MASLLLSLAFGSLTAVVASVWAVVVAGRMVRDAEPGHGARTRDIQTW